ncbi:hypothetical protein [Sphingobium sp. YR657]|uniref:hypothetical protein n=1 Tax=Sphingobium sp. YR657 TaxID=1884366 RepID=UPI0031378569
MQQADLFDTASGLPTGPEGLTYRSDVIDTATEAHLIAAFDALPLAPFRFQGWLGKRLTCSFGWSYDFDTAQVAAAPPIPDWLMPIRRKAAELLAIGEAELVQALLIRYDPGAGIGWHRDRPIFGHVAGLSLVRRPRCGCGGAGRTDSIATLSHWRADPFMGCPAPYALYGSTASRLWRIPAGQSPSAA